MADSSAGILTEGEFTLGSNFSVAEHGESYELVVLACFGIGEDFSHHLIVFAAEHESVVMSSLTCEHSQSFGINYKKFVTAPVLDFNIVRGEVIVLGCVGTEGKHLLIFKRFCCHIMLDNEFD